MLSTNSCNCHRIWVGVKQKFGTEMSDVPKLHKYILSFVLVVRVLVKKYRNGITNEYGVFRIVTLRYKLILCGIVLNALNLRFG